MSGEGSDTSYRPKKRQQQPVAQTRGRTRCPRKSRVDYTEVEILSESDSEGTIDSNEIDKREIKSERGESMPLLEVEGDQNQRIPGTLSATAKQVSQQYSRLARVNSEETMAREGETGTLQKIMEMMVQMRAEDRKVERDR